MRALVQRVTEASVSVAGQQIAAIDAGALILICAMPDDGPATAQKLAAKIARLRIFADGSGRMNTSLLDSGGSALLVSQFTLAADTSRGNRPGFSAAASPDLGDRLYQEFVTALAKCDVPVQTGQFGADMAVALVNDGPVTIWIDTQTKP